MLRARVRWLEEGETCSSYFFSRFRSRPDQSMTSLLCNPDGTRFASTQARRDYVETYYSGVYASPHFSSDACSSFLSSISLPTLSPNNISSLLRPFSIDELRTTIRALPHRKAPGPDGLPYEWYQTFMDDLLPLLLPLFNGILQGDSPPPSWSQTLVTLIPKPDHDLSSLANWRPITLSNCDVKIFSRLLATRLALILPDLIAPNQAGFIQGRQAADIAMVYKSVLGHASTTSVPGALVFLDQEKAYDHISHDDLFATLSHFGFPLSLQQVFAATFLHSSTYILDNDHPVGPIAVRCGVWQGDPLAPLLFNLCFKPLLVKMHQCLQRIPLPWGVFMDGACTDNSGYGVLPSEGNILKQTLTEYCTAANA